MRGKNRRGDVYFYYICRGRQNHTCDLPYMPVASVEEAVADHYVTVMIPADLRDRIHRGVDSALSATATINDELIDGIKQQITKLDAQEDQYLELVGDPDWHRDKIAERLRKIRDERAASNTRSARASVQTSTPKRTPCVPSLNCSHGQTSSTGPPTIARAEYSIRRSSYASTSTPTTAVPTSTTTSRQSRSRRPSPYTGPNNAKAAAPPAWATPPLTAETQQRPYSQPP